MTFSPRGRLELTDLVINPSRAGPLYQRPIGMRVPPLLRVGSIQIDCGLAELLRGRLRPTRIELRHVNIAVVCNPACPQDEAATERVDADARLLWDSLGPAGNGLPVVVVPQADVQVFIVEGGAPQLVQRMLLRPRDAAPPAATACGSIIVRPRRRPWPSCAGTNPPANVRCRWTGST